MGDENQVLDWDGVLENDGSEFPVLPEGDYAFEVTGFERGSFPGSEKMCACNKATLTLKVDSGQGTTTVFDDLILHKRMEWKLSQFFRAIGQKKKGERVTMNWNAVIGARGRAHIYVNKYTDKRTGEERENNKVSKYLDYDESQMQKAAGVDKDGFMQIPEGAADELPFD